jgi:regulator of protease activity HflC (stomatin/prohibitin superfamily)
MIMDERLLFALRLSLLIGISLIAFFLTGIVRVKKDHVVVVSSFRHFKRILNEGLYYFPPLLFQATRQLPKSAYTTKISRPDGKILQVTCLLEDPRAYYEAHASLKKTIQKASSGSGDEASLRSHLQSALKTLGFALIEAKIIER